MPLPKTNKSGNKSKNKPKKPKLTFTVDRSQWSMGGFLIERNHPNGGDTMCVLGFLGKRLGMSKDELIDISHPGDITNKYYRKKFADLGLAICDGTDFRTSPIANKIMETNDDHKPDKNTEKHLREYFNKLNIRVRFIKSYIENDF